jgi:hypothetical protein
MECEGCLGPPARSPLYGWSVKGVWARQLYFCCLLQQTIGTSSRRRVDNNLKPLAHLLTEGACHQGGADKWVRALQAPVRGLEGLDRRVARVQKLLVKSSCLRLYFISRRRFLGAILALKLNVKICYFEGEGSGCDSHCAATASASIEFIVGACRWLE